MRPLQFISHSVKFHITVYAIMQTPLQHSNKVSFGYLPDPIKDLGVEDKWMNVFLTVGRARSTELP